MPLRRWFIDPALVITFLACFGLFLFVAIDFAYLKAKQHVSEQTERTANTDQTKDHVKEVCRRLDGAEWRKCALDLIEPYQQQSQDTRDLHAQEWMARWAFWMFFAAAAGTGVAGYGLVLLRRTWVEAKRTVDVTREIGEAQSAAYISIQNPRIQLEHGRVEFEAMNCGGTPAYRVFVRTRFGGRRHNHHFSIIDPAHGPTGVALIDAFSRNEISSSERMTVFSTFEDVYGRKTFRRAKYYVPGFGTGQGEIYRFFIAPGSAMERRCKKSGK